MDYQTIQLPDFLSVIQVTIQLLDHSAIGQLLAIQLPDMSDNRMPTVYQISTKTICLIEYLSVDALFWDLSRDLVCPDGMLDGPLAEAEECSDEGQGHGHAEPQGQQGHQGEEGDGSWGSLVPQDQVHDEEQGKDNTENKNKNHL